MLVAGLTLDKIKTHLRMSKLQYYRSYASLRTICNSKVLAWNEVLQGIKSKYDEVRALIFEAECT